jgi:hypothetical protein
MNTSLILKLNGQWKIVDLYEDIPISVVIEEMDVTDFQGRKSPYSKQFSVPGTNNNNRVFEEYFEVNGVDFDPLVKIDSVVQYRGTDIFNGTLRLQAVVINDTFMEYQVYIIGEVGDFISEIKDLTLQELNYSDLQHELTYDNIQLSWEAKDNNVDGLFGGAVIYPMVNLGLPYSPSITGGTNTFPDFSYSFSGVSSFSSSGSPISVNYFKPAIRLSEVVDRVFAQTSYTVNSDFLNTDYFKSIYLDTFQNGKLDIEVASAVTNQNLFISYRTNITKTYVGTSDFRLLFNTNLPGSFDPLNNFYSNTATFRSPYVGNYSFNVRFNYESQDITQIRGSFRLVARVGTNPSNLNNEVWVSNEYQLGWRLVGGRQSGSVNEFFTVPMTPGLFVGVFIEEMRDPAFIGIQSPRAIYAITPFNSGGVIDRFIRWDLYNSPTLEGTKTVDFKLGIPNIRCQDFIKALIVMFNLVIVQEQDSRTLKIIPYNEYYNEPDRIERDWTQKLDLTSSYKIEPLSFDLPKELNYTYTRGSEEYLNKIFEDTNEFNYGRFKFVSSSNLLTDTQTYELPFAALPTSGVTNAPNFIIPQIYRDLNGQEAAYSSKPHIFFWAGNRYSYTDALKEQQGIWYMLDDSSVVQPQTTYPCVSHLSSLDIYYPEYVSDLNFAPTFDFFGNSNVFPVQNTPYTLYNSFWIDYINNNYSNETRRLTGRFWLEPIDLYETSLTDKIYIKDSFYRIEKINEGNLIEPTLTEVSLIKERGGYYTINPPAPYYFVEPNAPYPTTTGLTEFVCYVDNNSFLVCNSSAPVTLIYKQFPTPLQNGSILYTYSAPNYIPLPQGTFVKQVGEPDSYVVINNIGQIIQATC